MAGQLNNRIALITGGGTGIGSAAAVRFALEGARIALCGRREAPLRETQAQIGDGCLIGSVDVTDLGQVRTFVEQVRTELGGLHIVVNNAGINARTPLMGDDPDIDQRYRDIVDVNLTGTWNLARAAAGHLPGDGTGRIINVSSVLGKFGVPGYGPYCAAKAGVIGLTRALALELAPKRVTVNCICPGWVATDMALESVAQQADEMDMSAEEFRRMAEERVPLERFLEPEEIAGLMLYLASDAARGMTGQAVNLDGGAIMF